VPVNRSVLFSDSHPLFIVLALSKSSLQPDRACVGCEHGYVGNTDTVD
jgi:hypothetical protein